MRSSPRTRFLNPGFSSVVGFEEFLKEHDAMVVLLVQFTVFAGRENEAQTFIQKMQDHTRREPGCRMYLGHQSSENSRHFILYEQYDDKAALDAHRAATYFCDYITNGLGKLMENVTRELFQPIESTASLDR
jgi:quinol monooxygenase YgiN